MDVRNLKAGDLVTRQQEPVVEWYLIKSGSVVRKFAITETVLHSGAIIGLMEGDFFDCDYVAVEDSVLIVLPCKNAEDLSRILESNTGYRQPFLKTALDQRQQALTLYGELYQKAEKLHDRVEALYSDYEMLCNEFVMPQQSLMKMQQFEAVHLQHRAEQWEISASNSIAGVYQPQFLKFASQDSAICVGAIMEASAQMHRITLGIRELITYLVSNCEILYSEAGNNLYHLYHDLGTTLTGRNENIKKVKEKLSAIVELMKELELYERFTIKEAEAGSENFGEDNRKTVEVSENFADVDCVQVIMEYAGFDSKQIFAFKELLEQYAAMADRHGSDDQARALRKEISDYFYQIYYKAFVHSVEEKDSASTVIQMFFLFGFLDAELAGEEATNALYGMLSSISLFESLHIHTFYSWLLSIYRGEKEPSKNDMGQDYPTYLLDLRKERKITEKQEKELLNSPLAKVKFEINHAFRSAQRISYGRVTSFCPVMAEGEAVGTYSAMSVTAERLQTAVNKVRKVDYSIFYREVLFSDEKWGIQKEWIKKEILPDMILLPNIGEKVFLWQECSGKRSSTPARFMIPIFMIGDLDKEIVANLGRFRWEICRKEEGAYWNDIREHSLTAEYCNYLQFYKKNSDLSPTAKEKVKMDLQKGRNNYREVFTSDYEMWVRYESQGSFRLNKLTREILVRTCPFNAEIRQKLKTNPQFEQSFARIDTENEKKITRLNALYNKYTAAGYTLPAELQENLLFYSM